MGTLYNCLREARLEKYYPAFRANGITRSEALANLTMPEFCAMGISGAEDRRRLVELVNIIKSVHRGQSASSARKRQPGSPTPSSSRLAAAGGAGFSSSQSDKKVPRRRPRSPSEGAVGGSSVNSSGMRLEHTRDVSVRERGPNFSVASYMDMLEFMSDSSSHSDGGDQLSRSLDSDSGIQPPRAADPPPPPPPTFSNKVPRKVAQSERIKQQSKAKGYNYGVPGNRESVKSKTRASSSKITKDDKIRVCVRKRPLSRREVRGADVDIVEANSTTTVVIKEPKVAVDLKAFTMKHEFVFDEVFDETCSNEDVYIRAARPLISSVFHRGNATFFAYGQTGAGKTHTMLGGSTVPGLYQLAAQDVFDIMASGQHGTDLHVWVSFFEIYCGQLFDLLNRRNRLVAREDGSQRVCIAGLTETEVPDVHTLIRVLEFGNSVRSRGTSGVNPDSSRSHAVLQMEIRHADETKIGKISFIDLAGSERASDMGDPNRQTRMEGAEINQSLLALKECIRSIDQESRHTPFRQSKLTHILKDAFVGNSRTCMIANLSPVQSACEHTLNTLRYADRVKELRRDSSQSGASPSFGHAMNLLMNIPITAPSIFHPSNVLSTSTPIRPRLQDHAPSAAADITLDPTETPIRGHNVQPKSASKSRQRYQAPVVSQSSSRPQLREAWQASTSRSHTEAAASQGLLPPHPEASPSESDHTDTDSCNVTHPTETHPAPSQPNIPVIGSTDSEFDFPTSDFNNVDDQLNDLSRGRNNLSQGGVKLKKTEGQEIREQFKGQESRDQASAASASGPRSESQRSESKKRGRPEHLPANQLSGETDGRSVLSLRQSSPSPSQASTHSKTLANSAATSNSSAASPHATAMVSENVTSEILRQKPAGTSRLDSLDDEMLFGGPREFQSPPQTGALPDSKANKHLVKALPTAQTALSSDLTSFSQRSPFRNGSERTTNQNPREQHKPSPDNFAASPRLVDEFNSGKVISKDPAQDKNQLPSPSAAAVKDWVTQKGELDPASGKGHSKKVDKQSSKATAATSSAQVGNQPFASYMMADNSPRSQLSAREKLSTRPSSQSPALGDSSSPVKAFPLHGMSGPSSDPTVQNMSFGAKDNQYQSSNSLPSHCNPDDTRHDIIPQSHRRDTSVESVSSQPSSVFSSTKTSSGPALVTEKLISGAVFSPIHPQPVSTPGGRPSSVGYTVSASNSSIVHPMPVTGAPSALISGSVMSPATTSTAERDQARVSLVAAHEDQLAAITSLCKQEMKLLLNAKKSVPRSFDDYMARVSSILAQKMSAIQLLQDEMNKYQTRFSANHQPLFGAAGCNDFEANSNTHT